ncbi:hypothetical protein SAMN06297129_0890 [Pseudooceanicola antarcticus]|uniref:Lipoprotein n=1 Tax=Pseudooceanicola antarcticus TaxID=1247613 RepID=A0A285I194_9RHOB|nr:hypothetical protein [Pseudooceanicola antarcticus]PJE30255.1 hypothetical protein CVM39_05955 [Pseudooceanicola antarcticus]SNY41653.1 hypothetical protein SAMN06297129_0890 [Pseudooceanicola antarcticus]
MKSPIPALVTGLWAGLVASLAAGPALALSCVPIGVGQSYNELSAAPGDYVVLLGDFDFEKIELPEQDLRNPDPEEVRFPARFTGQVLDDDGFGGDFALDLTVLLRCFGPWCAGQPDPGEALAFVQKTATGLVLGLGPCDGRHFSRPEPSDIALIEACHAQGACPTG